MLGVEVDLSRSASRVVVVANKADRLDALDSQVSHILHEGTLTQPEAAKLRGRLSYAEGQLFGRVAAVGMVDFRRRAAGIDFGAEVPSQMAGELRFIVRFLRMAVPRQLVAGDTRPPLMISLTLAWKTATVTQGLELS